MLLTRRVVRLAVVVLVIATITAAAGAAITTSLYRAEFEHHRAQLVEMVESEAALIAAVARYDAQANIVRDPAAARAATLSQVREAWRRDSGFGQSGEFRIARRDGDTIEFLGSTASEEPLPRMEADADIGEPMRRALRGENGTVIARDYLGQEVLAAYAWVDELEVGVVAKMPLREVQAPLWRGALIGAGFGGALIILGSLFILSLGDRREREITTERARYLALFEGSPDGQFVLSGGRFEEANEKACAMWQRSRDEIIGATPGDFSPATQPGGRLSRDEALARLEAARDGTTQTFEWQHLRADGTEIATEITLKSIELHGDQRVMATMRDITERRETDGRLRRLATAIGQITEGILISDADGRIEYVNEALTRITGYARHELLGKTPSILKSGHQDDDFYRAMWDTIRAGRVWQGKLINRRKDGTFYEEEMIISPVRGEDGEIHSYVAAKRDVTERALLESQLQQAQKMEAVGHLAGGVAHDFNNMLTGITGYAQLLHSNLQDERDRSDLQQILALSLRAADLTQQLLAFSRRQQLEQSSVDINALVGSTLKMLRRLIPEDIEVEFEHADEISPVMADSGQLVQVLMNLTVNARDAMPQGGKLIIETTDVELDEQYALTHVDVTPGRYVMLSISDTGTGMDAESREHIFEPFFTTKSAGEGTGLGLATVYGIVKQHGGHIGVHSELGFGTSFKVYLPATDAAAADIARDPEELVEVLDLATVLLVEDEEAVREIIERTLCALGCQVLSAGRSSEARQIYAGSAQSIDLLLTDVVMPGGLGTDLYKELSALDPDLKVLFMSGYPDRGTVQLAEFPAGAKFLRKPFSPSKLVEQLRQLIRDE